MTNNFISFANRANTPPVGFKHASRILAFLLVLLTFGVGQMWGAPSVVSYNESTKDTETSVTSSNITNGTAGRVSWSATGATWNSKKSRWDIAVDGTITFSVSSGYQITQIVFTTTSNKGTFSVSPTATITGNGSSPCTISGLSASSVTVTVSGQTHMINSSVTVTYEEASSSKTLSSISVQTAPTKKKYVAGEMFDPTGLVITRTYSDATSDTYAYAGHTSDFTFSPTTSTALTTSNTSVSITYGGKSTSQAINVYNVTMQARDEDGNAIPSGGPGAPTRSGKNITPAADANNYVFKQWQVTNASLGSGATAKSNTITNPTGAVTVTAVYYKPIPVSWNKNGSLYETTYTGYNQKPVFPENPSSCDLTSNTFYGWATSTWDNTVDNLAGKTVYTSASSMPNVTAIGVVYNAVFAKVSEGAASWTKVTNSISAGDIIVLVNETASKELTSIGDINGTSCGKTSAYSTTPTGTFPLTVETGNGGNGFSFKNGSNYLSWSSGNSLITSTTINNASSWTINNPSNGNYTFSNIGDNTRKLQYNSGSPRFCCYTSSQQAFQIYKRSVNITYSKYLTSCCTALAQVEGSANLSQWNAGVHIY